MERLISRHVSVAEAQKRLDGILDATPLRQEPKALLAEGSDGRKVISVKFEPRPDITRIQIQRFFDDAVKGGAL